MDDSGETDSLKKCVEMTFTNNDIKLKNPEQVHAMDYMDD
jgi:hypothetical protein